MLVTTTTSLEKKDRIQDARRSGSQPLLPQRVQENILTKDDYQIFPHHAIGPGKIFIGYESLANWIKSYPNIIIDGYNGVFWQDIRASLSQIFDSKGLRVNWIDVASCMKSAEEIQRLVEPFLGGPETLWGKKFEYELKDFFHSESLDAIRPDDQFDVIIVYGTGAALVNWEHAPIIYMDVPKNEIQYRMRAGSVVNLGNNQPERLSDMYKRFYFVDWVVLNGHKKRLLNKTSIFADVQWLNSVNWMKKESLHDALHSIGKSVFRVRPWFEAGAWGGQWMKDRLKGINKDEVNYAWSFELIVPENGLVFESDGYLLELSFDFLMFAESKAVLGKHAKVFGDEFPIRFDFLDTWNGGNLSIQCHPTLSYIRQTFGESITQDETYYILACKDNAQVYLGFQENIDPEKFRNALENSRINNTTVPIEEYVQVHTAHKHDLFLIPNGTVHSAGTNNVVLEISATPYIFTFKMYDWVRLDLNGEPRAINIEHAFNNLDFERKGDSVGKELISNPRIIQEGNDWKLIHLPTHAAHFYDVHRFEFDSSIKINTDGSCHVLMLVEGTSVSVRTADGTTTIFHFAETFVIPAATEEYTITNLGKDKAKLVKAFLKENIDFLTL